MLCFLPFTFDVTGIRPGKRNEETLHFSDELPVKLKDVPVDEAPLAYQLEKFGMRVAHYRVVEGRPITHLVGPDVNKQKMLSLDDFLSMIERLKDPQTNIVWKDYPLPFLRHAPRPFPRMATDLPKASEARFREVLSSRRAERAAIAEKAARGLASIGGVMWTAAPEIVWAINRTRPGQGGQSLIRCFQTPFAPGDDHHVFRADRGAEAAEFARMLGDRYRRDVVVEDPGIDAGLIRWELDDVAHEIVKTARTLQRLARSQEFSLLPTDVFEPFLRMRDACKADLEPEELDAAAIGQSLVDLDAILNAHPTGRADDLIRRFADELDAVALRLTTIDEMRLNPPTAEDVEAFRL